MPKLIIQLHTHSNRSFDSGVPVIEYIRYFESKLSPGEYGVLGITDHNILPIAAKDALALSTENLLVIPGIQWRLQKTAWRSISRLCTRRALITLGNHDNLKEFLKSISLGASASGELSSHIKEDDLLRYAAINQKIILVVPHPRHFFFDYYGTKEIASLRKKMEKYSVHIPLFIEKTTGYDPFPRLLRKFNKNYLILGSSDAHEIFSFLGTESFFSVRTEMPCDTQLIGSWRKAIKSRDLAQYEKTLSSFFGLLSKNNNEISIKKYYLRTAIHFLHSLPLWFTRRFNDFPRNLLK